MDNKDFKVDAVYLWCDGDDPNFQAAKAKRMAEVGNPLLQRATSASEELVDYLDAKNRYESHDELKYSLRSLEKYAPWINHVFIVTNKQRPKWLKESDKLTIVDHEDIIPHELLPTFNSCTIEQYIINIKGLSEHFIFLNDDMFFNKHTPQSAFFEKGKPIVYLQKPWRRNFIKSLADVNEARKIASPYIQSVLNGYQLILEHRKKFLEFCCPTHSIDAYSKSIVRSILEEYPETYERNVYPFRNTNEIVRAFWILEMVHFHNCPCKINKQPKSLVQRILKKIGFYKTNAYEFQAGRKNKTYERFVSDLKGLNPYHFCCNNLTGKKGKLIMEYLEKRFSEKSSFEKSLD